MEEKAGHTGVINLMYGKDEGIMVKGVTRRVIVVKSPDRRLFEQAIFIVKEDAFGKGASAEAVLQEARRAADGYLKRASGWRRVCRKIPAPVYAAGGALGATVCWLLAILL